MARSTLELLLESIKDREEPPPDQLPVLPQRPTSRGRLPSKKARSVLLFSEQSNHQNGTHQGIYSSSSNGHSGWKQENSHVNGNDSVVHDNAVLETATVIDCQEHQFDTEIKPFQNKLYKEAFISLKKRKRDQSIYNWPKDAKVWFLNNENKWTLAAYQSASEMGSAICMADGKLIRMQAKEIFPANPEVLDTIDDLMQLSYINEPAVLHSLQRRYSLGKPYTKAGPLLVALGSCEEQQNRNHNSSRTPKKWTKVCGSPHDCSVANRAFEAMKQDDTNQSIIISGDSGSVKMETAKLALEYLVSCSGNKELGNLLLMSHPVLEAFGHAKQHSNTNGSRFGTMLHMYYDQSGTMSGAELKTVLFEKSRVVHQNEGERSYHIFYQLCEGADPSLRDKLNIRTAEEFNYLRQNQQDIIDKANYAAKFQSLLNSLHALGFTNQDQYTIFSMLAAILWLGNINASKIDDAENKAMYYASKLLQSSKDHLLAALCVDGCNPDQVVSARDALAQDIYERLFRWVIVRINSSLKANKSGDSKCITIVDMPGLESTKRNGLECLLVNYSHEYLQQFTQCSLFQQDGKDIILGEPKIEFLRENGIIDFLEQGLFPLLNDNSNCGGSKFTQRLEQLVAVSTCCKQKTSEQFTILHGSREVTYDSSFLLEGLKDQLNSQLLQIVNSCMSKFPEDLNFDNKSLGPYSSRCQEFILKMMEHLDNTTPHFILCITPNESLHGSSFNEDIVLQQMRYYCLPEAIRAFKSGYPEKISQVLFIRRFGGLLVPGLPVGDDDLSKCIAILQCLDIPPQMYQVGLTQLFFRPGQIDKLEDSYNKFLERIVAVQNTYRGYKLRSKFKKQKRALIYLQASIRGWLQRKALTHTVEKEQGTTADTENAEPKPVGGHQNGNASILNDKDDTLQVRSANGDVSSEKSEWERSQIEKMTIALQKKENEAAILQQSLQEYRRKWSDYESKMKSMEEMWTKQIESLQQNLNSSRRVPEEPAECSVTEQCSEQTTGVHGAESEHTQETPPHAPDLSVGGRSEIDPSRSVIDRLTKEYEHRTQVFNDDADFLVEVKSGQIEANFKPDEELQKLRQRFDVWKKDFKARLKETKNILKKLGKPDSADKKRKRWWSR